MPVLSARRSFAAAAVLGTLIPAVAAANAGYPNVHTPRLYGADTEFADPATAEFGGRIELYVGNSDHHTHVVVCVSGRCRRLHQNGDNRYAATGSHFALRLKRGQQRTVEISASNPGHGSHWGPQRVTVR